MRAGSFGPLTRAPLAAGALSVAALVALAACSAQSARTAQQPANTTETAATDTGGASAGATAEPAFDKPILSPLDQALADLQRAESEIGVAVQAVGGAQLPKSPAATPPPAATSPGGGTAPKPDKMPPASAPKPSEAELSSDPCFSACRALASMTRSAAHICELTGEPDARCDSARSRLRDARERVEGSCTCQSTG